MHAILPSRFWPPSSPAFLVGQGTVVSVVALAGLAELAEKGGKGGGFRVAHLPFREIGRISSWGTPPTGPVIVGAGRSEPDPNFFFFFFFFSLDGTEGLLDMRAD